jgi:hypothetical protein
MTLVMKTQSRGVVRFEWSDEDAETTISIEAQDDDATMIRKLKRVIALVEGEQAPASRRVPDAYDRGVASVMDALPPQTGNGWAAYAPPEVPEHLQGEVELIPPGEDA